MRGPSNHFRSAIALPRGPKRVVLVLCLVMGLAILAHLCVPSLDPNPRIERGAGDENITIAFSTAAGGEEVTVPMEAVYTLENEEYAWIARSSLPPTLEAASSDPSTGVATVGEWALVGDLSTATERIGPREVTIVAPTASSADPRQIASDLAAVTGSYDLAPGRSEPVRLLFAPEDFPDRGRMYERTGYVTTPFFRAGDVSSVWLHEYVHAVQTFDTDREMQWFREASATYFSMRFMADQYRTAENADVREHLLALEPSMVCLCNVTACRETNAHYYRGAQLLYVIDAAIRRSTNGTATLVDVFREMNDRDESISLAEFQDICEAVSGSEMEWIRPAIREKHYDLERRITDSESFGKASSPALWPLAVLSVGDSLRGGRAGDSGRERLHGSATMEPVFVTSPIR